MDKNHLHFRDRLGKNIVYVIVLGTVIIPIPLLICIFSGLEYFDKSMSFIGQSLLPLWGTWVGAVLAYYFGKSNFETTAKTYQNIIDKITPEEKISSINICSVMVPFTKIAYLDYENDMNNSVTAILKLPKFDRDYSHFPVISNQETLKYIINRREFTGYIAEKVIKNENSSDIQAISLEKFIEDINNRQTEARLDDAVFVSKDSTLLDAKRKMEHKRNCYIVFISESGHSSEPVIGFVTNNIIINYLVI